MKHYLHKWLYSNFIEIEYDATTGDGGLYTKIINEPMKRKCINCGKEQKRTPFGGMGGWNQITIWKDII